MICYFCRMGRHDLHLARWTGPDRGVNVVFRCTCTEPDCDGTHMVVRRKLDRLPKTWVDNIRNEDPRREEMRTLWLEGVTHHEIAKRYGISRERVGQLIGRAYMVRANMFPPEITFIGTIARELGVVPSTVEKWAKEHPDLIRKPGTLRKGLINAADVAQYYAELYMRPCVICRKPVKDWKAKRCPRHRSGDYESRPYRTWTEERKRKFTVLNERWARENPERNRTMNRRSNLVYRLTKEGVPRETARKVAAAKYPYVD